MKVLYVTDDRSNYRQGYYYVDWLQVFREHHQLTLWGPSYGHPSARGLAKIDLVVIGHGAVDALLNTGTLRANLRGFWRTVTGRWPVSLRQFTCPKIMLSKNDYKAFDAKAAFVKRENINLIVTHTRNAVSEFTKRGVETLWIPFGVSSKLFRNLNQTRDIDIGFRGNFNSLWNDSKRDQLIDFITRECSDLRLDILGSTRAENFLFGEDYVRWMNRCHLMLNTISALGTVGPKWWEQMACGTVPLAPIDTYEGLLEPDVHYVSVQNDLADLRAKVERYLHDKDFAARIQQGITMMAAEADMSNRYKQLWAGLRERGLV